MSHGNSDRQLSQDVCCLVLAVRPGLGSGQSVTICRQTKYNRSSMLQEMKAAPSSVAWIPSCFRKPDLLSNLDQISMKTMFTKHYQDSQQFSDKNLVTGPNRAKSHDMDLASANISLTLPLGNLKLPGATIIIVDVNNDC